MTSLTMHKFGNMTLEQKRSMVTKILGNRVERRVEQHSPGLFATARRELVEACGLDKALSRRANHYLYDEKGREYLDFSPQVDENSSSETRGAIVDAQYLVERLKELEVTYPAAIKMVDWRAREIDLRFRPVQGNDGSAILAYFSLNDYLSTLISSYLFNVHRIVTAPAAEDGHVVRLQSPAKATRAEMNRAVDAISAVCDILDHLDAYRMAHHLVSTGPTPKASGRSYMKKAPRQLIEGSTSPNERPASKFAFLIHPTTEHDLLGTDPSFEQFSAEELERWRAWAKLLRPGLVQHVDEIRSPAGHNAEGWIMVLPRLPQDMLTSGRKKMLPLLEDAQRLAHERGATVLGLGGFTSILSGGGHDLTGKGTAITSGNTLTTATAIAGIEDVAARVGLDLADAHAAVVGATGSIGRLAALMLASRVGSLTLVGNPSNPNALQNCRGVVGEIRGLGTTLPVQISLDPDTALSQADIVLVATNSDTAMIRADQLKEGAIICDVARPPNVADDVVQQKNVLVFDGGMVQLPQAVAVGTLQGLALGVAWGCLAETILLALEGEAVDHSIGQKLSLAEADYIARLASKHGFRPAPTEWYGRTLSDEDFSRVAAVLSTRGWSGPAPNTAQDQIAA